jgi:hypothetical protein
MTTNTSNPMTGACYILTNNTAGSSMLNLGMYSLTNSNNLFNIGIIFAANINYDVTIKSAVLYLNDTVTNVLKNADTLIRPLQAKGIKILLSILGNHQGAGISNLPDQASAQAFAKQLSNAVSDYGLDGIDFDDEWAEYGNNGTGQPNEYSFPYLVQALRNLMGQDKIISFYCIGPAASSLSYDGINAGSLINYAWNPFYGNYEQNMVPDLPNSNWGPAALCLNSADRAYTPVTTAVSLAQEAISDNYVTIMYYDLPNGDQSSYLTKVSQVLYGESTVYTKS